MVFNSYTFIVFFAITAALHALPLPWVWKKRNLLLASYLFYAAWSPPFVLLLWISTLVDWHVANRMAESHEPTRRKRLLWLSLGINLGLLGYFKYSSFLLSTLSSLLQVVHIQFQPASPDIILPAGISFYTFMTLSYSLDVYHRRSEPCRSFLDYALFLTFFPHLVAGPIVRAAEFTPQLETPRRATGSQFGLGVALMILGLFEKSVLADYFLAPAAEQVFQGSATPDTVSAWCAAVAFAGQVFCDFSGYTTCAIGVAMCFGFVFPENFRFPYAAVGFADFWRRWHMTLSRWLRDYLYIPLGGNRHGELRTYRNLMITMLLGGLWHGASWSFVLWGGLHGALLVLERAARRVLGDKVPAAGPVRATLALATFLCICVAWVFFAARSVPFALRVCASLAGVTMAGAQRLHSPSDVLKVAIVMSALLLTHHLLRETTWRQVLQELRWPVRGVVLGVLLVLIALAPGADRAFIYFQF